MIATVTLNPSIDYIVKAESLLPGGITRTREESVYPGGKGINVSVMLAGLGQESCAFGFTAGFTGEKIEGDLRAFGCRTAMIELKEGFSRINVKIHAQEESEINGHGPVITQEDVGRLLERLDGLKEGDWLVLAGSIPPGLPRNLYGQILARIQGRGIGCIVDAEGEALRCTLSGHPFLIKPNRHELSQLCGKELHTREEVIQAARCLQQQGARNVLVSMAGDGALLVPEDGPVLFRAPNRGQVVNSVGAGDSMVAGFLAGWCITGSMERALELGTACGSATAFTTWIADREQVAAQLANPGVFGLAPQEKLARPGKKGEKLWNVSTLEGEKVWVEFETTGAVCCAGSEEAPLEDEDFADVYRSGVFTVEKGMLVSVQDSGYRIHPFNGQITAIYRWLEEK